MNNCSYYSCKNGNRKCNNPSYQFTDLKILGTDYCAFCKRLSGGIYPSQLPREDFTDAKYDVIDKKGKVVS